MHVNSYVKYVRGTKECHAYSTHFPSGVQRTYVLYTYTTSVASRLDVTCMTFTFTSANTYSILSDTFF